MFFFCVTNLTFFFHKLNYFLKLGGSGNPGREKGSIGLFALIITQVFFFFVAVLTKKERAPHNQPTTQKPRQHQLVEQHTVKHAALALALEIVQQLVDVVVQIVTLGHHRYQVTYRKCAHGCFLVVILNVYVDHVHR